MTALTVFLFFSTPHDAPLTTLFDGVFWAMAREKDNSFSECTIRPRFS